MERHPANVYQKATTDFHRFDFDGMRQAHGGHLKHLESISFSRLHGERDKLTQTQLLAMQSFKTSLDQMTGPPWALRALRPRFYRQVRCGSTHLCQLT